MTTISFIYYPLMLCANHSDNRFALTTCQDCGQGLCWECAGQYSVSLCRSCARQRLSIQKGRAVKELFVIALAFFIGGHFMTHNSDQQEVTNYPLVYFCLGGILFAGVVAAWDFIKKRENVKIIYLNGSGPLWFLLVKMVICALIGPYLLPFKIYQNIQAILAANTIELNSN